MHETKERHFDTNMGTVCIVGTAVNPPGTYNVGRANVTTGREGAGRETFGEDMQLSFAFRRDY